MVVSVFGSFGLPGSSTGRQEVVAEYFAKCWLCSKGFPSPGVLREHLQSVHNESAAAAAAAMAALQPPPLSTTTTTTTTSSSSSSTSSLTAAKHACLQCSATFSEREELERHELTHSPTAQVVTSNHIYPFFHCLFAQVTQIFPHLFLFVIKSKFKRKWRMKIICPWPVSLSATLRFRPASTCFPPPYFWFDMILLVSAARSKFNSDSDNRITSRHYNSSFFQILKLFNHNWTHNVGNINATLMIVHPKQLEDLIGNECMFVVSVVRSLPEEFRQCVPSPTSHDQPRWKCRTTQIQMHLLRQSV